MALIDFKCEKCGNEFFEIVYKYDEKVTCPQCGDDAVKRVFKGKFYGKGGGCGGGCSTCSGCH